MINIIPEKKFHLTFDIDWAPDFTIELCLEILKLKKIKATFFATHETDLNQEVILQGHELGIHPNFLNKSSQGNSPFQIIENCLNFAPDAKTIRTHALVQSTPLLFEIFNSFPQLELDLSIFMANAKYIERFKWQFDGVSFDRINYNWEDDAQFYDKNYNWSKPYFPGSTSIFDFHPIHVYLNSQDNLNYKNLKKDLSRESLSAAPKKLLQLNINKNKGAQNFLKAIIRSEAQSITLDEIK